MPAAKPTKEEILNAVNKTVPDIIAPHLKVLFCGINPGLYTAAIGHHFGRPGNRFWKALYEGGFTPSLFDPSEERELLALGYGITNVVPRATATAAEVTNNELLEGGKMLVKKVDTYKPTYVAIVGIGAYKIAFQQPKAHVGLQDVSLAGAKVWVLPNPSGLNANYTPTALSYLFSLLRKAVENNY